MDEIPLIGVYIKSINFFGSLFLSQPSVEGYLVDKTTEECIKANSSTSNLYSYKNLFTLYQKEIEKKTGTENLNKLLVIEKNFSDLGLKNKLLMFEICKTVQQKKTQEFDKTRIAFAFLIPLASDGSVNTNHSLKLQLYKIGKNCKISHQDCSIYHLYSEHKLKKLLGYLELSVKAVVPIKISHSDTEEKQIKERPKTEEKHKNDEFLALKPITKTWNWSRLPTQSCKVPNKIYKTISLGKNGFSCLQFSRSGSHIAAAVLSKIVVHDILSGNEVAVLSSHIGFIYELDWSCDDKYLLSVSNDCRGAVWDINQTTPLFILPHPSYVYCGKWFGDEEHIVTGGKDHLLRYWSKNDDGFQLLEEIGGHSGFISSLACQDNSVIISGDSHGCIMVRKLSNDGWNLMKKLSFPEISQKVIDSILILCSKRRIIISVRSRSSYLVDIVSGIILQTYKSSINTYARSVSCLTPCGSFLFSFCQNGDVGIWEVNTGKMFASYDNLFPIDRLAELSGCIRYHPHEHMVGVIASVQNSPLLILKYELTDDDDTKRLGLKFSVK